MSGMCRNAVAAAGLALTVLGGPASADDSVDGRALLDGFLNGVSSMNARFEQSLVDVNGEVVETSSGTLQIRRPGQFRWTYTLPYEQILVADGLNLWSYDVDLEQVTVKPQATVLANTPAILLGGNRSVLEDFEIVDTGSDRDAIWVRLRPINPDNGFDEVRLGFVGDELAHMIFSDSLEQETRINLADVRTNERLEDSFFEFAVPTGVDVVGEPLIAESADP